MKEIKCRGIESLKISRDGKGFNFEPKPFDSIPKIDYSAKAGKDSIDLQIHKVQVIEMSDGVEFLSEALVWAFKNYDKKKSLELFKSMVKQLENKYFEAV